MKAKNLFTIKFVSERTGLKPHVIRAWESRYGAVTPERTPTNHRLYCRKDIRRLNLLKMAIDSGHQISRIARADVEELIELLDLDEGPLPPPSSKPLVEPGSGSAETDYLQAGIRAVTAPAPERLNAILSEAAVQLTRQRWVEALIVPLFNQIGELWSSGHLKIVNEHLASNCARTIMGDMLQSIEVASNAPRIVIGTPVGQWHELGALAAALACAEAGWRPVYVGANLPGEELAAAVELFDAKGIGLSLPHCLDDSRLRHELLNLRRFIGPDRHILFGGIQEGGWEDVSQRVDALRIDCWHDLFKTLRLLAEA